MHHLSKAHLAMWRGAASAMLNSFELNSHLDFYWTVENDYSSFLEGHEKAADPEGPLLSHRLMSERIAAYRHAQEGNQLKYRKLFVFVNFEPDFRNSSYASRSEYRILLSEWNAAKEKLEQITDLARHPFTTCGMNTSLMKHRELQQLYYKTLSPHRRLLQIPQTKSRWESLVWKNVLLSDVQRVGPFLRFDEHYHAFVSMASLPQSTLTGFLSPLFDLSFPDYSIKFTIRTAEKQKAIRDLQSDYGSKRGLQLSKEKSGKPVDVEMESQAEEIREEIRTLTQSPQQIFHVQGLIHLWHPQEKELLRRTDEALIRMGYCGGIQGIIERIAAPEAFRASIPGWTRETQLDRFHVVKSFNAADFIPAHTDFIGTGRPQLLFPTPSGGLMTAHVFTESRPFHNIVVGSSGSGKTFLINSIATQLVGQGLKSLTLISTKDEFRPLMSMFGGETVSFSENQPVFVNPCTITGTQPTMEEKKGLLNHLETIFGEEPTEAQRKIRESRIFRAMGLTYDRYRNDTRLHHFVETFRNGWDGDNLAELRKLAIILEPYARGGVYGEFFDSATRKPLDLSNNFKFFDFSPIQKNVSLYSLMMMTLSMAESARLSKLPRHWWKAMIPDECWAMIDTVAGGNFIENALRINRAFNCSVFLSSQNITDFLHSRIVDVIMGNCDNYFLLRTHDEKAIRLMREKLLLTHELASRFAEMPDPSLAGYSKFIYVHRAGNQPIAGEAINRVISKPEALLYSTSPNISQLRDHLLKVSEDPWKAVCRLAEMTPEEIESQREKILNNH